MYRARNQLYFQNQHVSIFYGRYADIVDLGFQPIRGAHAVLLSQIEKGRLSWAELPELKTLLHSLLQNVLHISNPKRPIWPFPQLLAPPWEIDPVLNTKQFHAHKYRHIYLHGGQSHIFAPSVTSRVRCKSTQNPSVEPRPL